LKNLFFSLGSAVVFASLKYFSAKTRNAFAWFRIILSIETSPIVPRLVV
jgi:hypothetical protein